METMKKLTGNKAIKAAMLAQERKAFSDALFTNKAGRMFSSLAYGRGPERLEAKGRLIHVDATGRQRYGGYVVKGFEKKVDKKMSATNRFDLWRFNY